MSEKWKAVPDYEGAYEVSDLGRVRSLDRTVTDRRGRTQVKHGRILSLTPDDEGRLQARLYRSGQCRLVRVHRLVLLAFLGPAPEGHEGCHDDGDKLNNRLDNLRWDTRSENGYDAVRHGVHFPSRLTHCAKRHAFNERSWHVNSHGKRVRRCLPCRTDRGRRSSREHYLPAREAPRCSGSNRPPARPRTGIDERCSECGRVTYIRKDGLVGKHPETYYRAAS